MWKLIPLLFFTIHVFAGNTENLQKLGEIKRIAFGSCSDQKDPQPLWALLIKDRPDLFIHGGDNIYANTDDVKVLERLWQWLLTQKDYSAFRKDTPVIGIWDDHDFADDDADGKLKFKNESQKLFLDFLEEPKDSPRRNQEGIYTTHAFGKEDKKIKFILLDSRYFRNLDKKAPLLGEKQWKWLEEELKSSDAAINFIVSGISVLSPSMLRADEWLDFPDEYRKLLKLVDEAKAKGVVFLAGDKHYASIFRRDGHLEFLSSGMTHNRPAWMRPYLRSFYPNSTHELNYGLIDIEWTGNIPVLHMAIRTADGKSSYKESFILKENKWMPR